MTDDAGGNPSDSNGKYFLFGNLDVWMWNFFNTIKLKLILLL